MIRSEQSNKSSEREICWNRDESLFVRLELADGSCLMLPYGHLQFALLRSQSPHEILELAFASHRVLLTGTNLRKLMLAIQKHAVESVRIAPKSERMNRGDALTWIASIEVEEVNRNEDADTSAPE